MSGPGFSRAPHRARLIRHPVKFVVLALSVFAIAVSGRVLFGLARNVDIVDYARALEGGSAADAEYALKLMRAQSALWKFEDCGDLVTRSQLTVALAAVTMSPDAKAEGVERAIQAANRRLTCNPLDGNAWLQLARLSARRDGVNTQVLESLKLSWATAPSESWVLEPRLDLETTLLSSGFTELEANFSADLRLFERHEQTSRVALAYVNLGAMGRAALRTLIEADAEPRRKAIVAQIDWFGVDFGKP